MPSKPRSSTPNPVSEPSPEVGSPKPQLPCPNAGILGVRHYSYFPTCQSQDLSAAALYAATAQQLSLAERNQQAGKVLAERFDHLNQMLALTEDYFKSLKCPTHTYHWYHFIEVAPGISESEMLGFAKHKDKWRIIHGYDHEAYEGGPHGLQPLSDCPVEVRVRAASEISHLYQKIVEQKERFIPEVEKAIHELGQFFQSIPVLKGV